MTAMETFLAFMTIISLTFGCQNWSYVKTVGYRSNAIWDVRMLVHDVQECLDVCSKQKICQGFDFEHKTGFCYLHPSLSSFKNSSFENKNCTQYEKICLEGDKLVKICNRTVVHIPQKILVGLATRVVSAKNFESCIQNCADSEKNFDEKCRSAMFYSSNEIHENCVLSSDSAKGYPDYLTDEATDLVDYFELDCENNETQHRFRREITGAPKSRHRNVLRPNSPDWGSWTRCDGTGGSRFRYRQCKSPNPNSCQKDTSPCDPTNRVQEVQDILGEEGGNQNGNGNSMQFVTDQSGGQPVTDNGMVHSPLPVDGGGMIQPASSGGMVQPPTDAEHRLEPATGPRGTRPPTDSSNMVQPPTGSGGVVKPVKSPISSGGMKPPLYTGSGVTVQPNPNVIVPAPPQPTTMAPAPPPLPMTMGPAPPLPTTVGPPPPQPETMASPQPQPYTMAPAPIVPQPTTMAPAPFAPTDMPQSVLVTGGVSQPNFVFVQGNPKNVPNNTGQQMGNAGSQNNVVNQSGHTSGSNQPVTNKNGTKHHGHAGNNGAQEVELMPNSHP